MRQLTASIGGKHNARIVKTWRGDFPTFCDSLLSRVPETDDKASNGWVCGACFEPEYRHSDNFVTRDFLSYDYDHIAPDDMLAVLGHYRKYAYLAFTTWSHTAEKPRLRLWLPISRPVGYDEFQAISRKTADEFGIEKMARESHVPAQFYFRPAVKPFEELRSWVNDAPWVDADEVLSRYINWTDRASWPHRRDADGVHNEGVAVSPLEKPGVIGAWCRAFDVPTAIEKFDLPYIRVRE